MDILRIAMNSSDDNFVAGLAKLIIFTTAINKRLGYYEHDEHSSNIRKVGKLVLNIDTVDGDMLDILKCGAESEEAVLQLIADGKNNETSWEMEWGEYYTFNSIVNRRVCSKLYKLCSDMYSSRQPGQNVLMSAARASSV